MASCWGAVAQVMINDSSVIIIYATLLGAGEMISVMTSSLQYLSLCFLMIPFAYLAERIGKKRQILCASALGCLMLLGTAAAPWCGQYAQAVLMCTLLIFAVTISGYLSAWFPLLDAIVPPERTGLFFGRLRFAWQTVAMVFIFISGWAIGKHASIGALQIIIVLAGLGMLGRFWYVNDMLEEKTRPKMPWPTVWRDIVANRPLTGFSVYLFCLYALANATVPVVFIFAKKHLLLADNVIVISSACSMGGLLCGYLFGGWAVHRHGVKPVFLTAHLVFGVLNLLLLTIHSNSFWTVFVLIGVITAYGFFLAFASIAVSSEMMALSPVNNKAMSIAFCYSLYAAGLGFSRLIASVILGSGILAAEWQCGGITFTKYHTLFLFYGCGTIAISVLLVLVPALTRDMQRLPQEVGV